MPHEIRKSTFAIIKKDLANKSVKIIKAKDKIEYHIYKTTINKLVLPRPILWAIIVCNAKHVVKNIKTGIEIIGTRYTEDALRLYLRKTKKIKRVVHEVRFK